MEPGLAAWRKPAVAAVLAAAVLASAGTAGADEPEAYQLGVVGFYNPRLMYLKYQPLVDYLTAETGHPWVLAVGAGYQQTVDGLCSGAITLAYLGPFTYVRARQDCGAIPVVRLQTRGSPTYRSYIMVRVSSAVDSIRQLAGARFGFGSPLSTSSHLVPRTMLEAAGLVVGQDLTCRYFGHHERAARAVLLREVDACGVRDIVADKFVGRGLRVIARSAPIPNFPFVVGPGTAPELRKQLEQVLVEVPRHDPEARRRMEKWDEELAGGFAPSAADEFESVRGLAERVFGARALTLTPEALECGRE